MSKAKKAEENIKREEVSTISRAQHGALNNLSMIAFYIRKKNIPQEYIEAIEASSLEMLNEIKAL